MSSLNQIKDRIEASMEDSMPVLKSPKLRKIIAQFPSTLQLAIKKFDIRVRWMDDISGNRFHGGISPLGRYHWGSGILQLSFDAMDWVIIHEFGHVLDHCFGGKGSYFQRRHDNSLEIALHRLSDTSPFKIALRLDDKRKPDPDKEHRNAAYYLSSTAEAFAGAFENQIKPNPELEYTLSNTIKVFRTSLKPYL